MNEELTLEELENDYWHQPEYVSGLVVKCYELRKKPVKDLSVEDLRVLIGQNIGLKFLIPRAIDFLKEDILVEGDLFEGDLLQSVLNSNAEYWQNNEEDWKIVHQLFSEHRNRLKDFDTSGVIKDKWFDSFSKFEALIK